MRIINVINGIKFWTLGCFYLIIYLKETNCDRINLLGKINEDIYFC